MEIQRIHINEINFGDFMLNNIPVIIEGIDSSTWHLLDYFLDKETGTFNPTSFRLLCGDKIIPIHMKGQVAEMNINEFVDKLILEEEVYAKDWHMFHYCPTSTYTVPPPFIDDWLNWFWKRCRKDCDDYRFVYIGGCGTFTGVHHDVLASYSWSVNLLGLKRWTLWSPQDIPKLRSIDQRLIVPDARNGFYNPDLFPNVSKSSPIVIEQRLHEAIFVPSGWYHMVENLNICHPSVTLSLNHNWFNGYSLDKSWEYLLLQFYGIYKEIELYYPLREESSQFDINLSNSSTSQMMMSLPEWYHHSQFLLKVQAGMNQIEFLALICIRLYIFKIISMQNSNTSPSEKLSIFNIPLLRSLGNYLYCEFVRDIAETSCNNFDDYIGQCCSVREVDRRVVSNLISHVIDPAHLLSLLSNNTVTDPLVASFQRIRLHEIQILDFFQINALQYSQIQVKCILIDLLSQNKLRKEMLNSICNELNCNVEFFNHSITEYLDIITF